jgi:hypothetical protein
MHVEKVTVAVPIHLSGWCTAENRAQEFKTSKYEKSISNNMQMTAVLGI